MSPHDQPQELGSKGEPLTLADQPQELGSKGEPLTLADQPQELGSKGEPRCSICTRPAVPNRRLCHICIEKRQANYWQLVKAGICRDCKKYSAIDGKVRCVLCTEKARQDSAQRYARLKAKGICTYCRHHDAMPHKEVCFACFKKKARLDRARRQRSQQAWLQWILVVMLWSVTQCSAVVAERSA